MPRVTELGALALYDPDAARARILAALRASAGNITRAAAILRCSRETMDRYVRRLGLRAAVRQVRGAAGWDPGA